MQTILIVIHLMIVIALVAVVLLQRSEGGGLGIGGGGNAMSARGSANPLTRLTAILGIAFFVTSVSLGLLGRYGTDPTDVLDRIPVVGETIDPETGETVPGTGGVLDLLGPAEEPASSDSDVPGAGEMPGGGTSGGVPNN